MTPWAVVCQALLSMGFLGKNTGVGCYFLLQGIFPTQGLNLRLLYWLVDSLLLSHQDHEVHFVEIHPGVDFINS